MTGDKGIYNQLLSGFKDENLPEVLSIDQAFTGSAVSQALARNNKIIDMVEGQQAIDYILSQAQDSKAEPSSLPATKFTSILIKYLREQHPAKVGELLNVICPRFTYQTDRHGYVVSSSSSPRTRSSHPQD